MRRWWWGAGDEAGGEVGMDDEASHRDQIQMYPGTRAAEHPASRDVYHRRLRECAITHTHTQPF